jgi:hypothetical protein
MLDSLSSFLHAFKGAQRTPRRQMTQTGIQPRTVAVEASSGKRRPRGPRLAPEHLGGCHARPYDRGLQEEDGVNVKLEGQSRHLAYIVCISLQFLYYSITLDWHDCHHRLWHIEPSTVPQ